MRGNGASALKPVTTASTMRANVEAARDERQEFFEAANLAPGAHQIINRDAEAGELLDRALLSRNGIDDRLVERLNGKLGIVELPAALDELQRKGLNVLGLDLVADIRRLDAWIKENRRNSTSDPGSASPDD
jgi:hypothetical protein